MEFKDNQLFYANSIIKYGITPKGVHWNSKFNQYKRFEVLVHYIKEELSNVTILDIGCGFGDLLLYLNTNRYQVQSYTGIDCEQTMVNISKKRFPNHAFIVKNVLTDELPQADYYLSSGALNILSEKEFFLFIEKCYNQCTKGFAFNFLIEDSFTPIKKDKVITYCENLCENITLTQNYLYNDMTIFMEK